MEGCEAWCLLYIPSKRFLTIEFFSLSIAIFECSQRSIQHNLIGKKWKEEKICSGSRNQMEIYRGVEFKVIVSLLLKHIRHETLSSTTKAVSVHKENRQTERTERRKQQQQQQQHHIYERKSISSFLMLSQPLPIYFEHMHTTNDAHERTHMQRREFNSHLLCTQK